MNKVKLIVANWKMNFLHKQANIFCKKIILKKKKIKNEFIICPPLSLIFSLTTKFKQINFGAQDCSSNDKFGARTGDVNPKMLKDINCKYILIGHSERRQFHHENDILICSKIKSALKSNISPILCIGENITEKNKGITKKILKNQLRKVLSPSKKIFKKVVIAYEPIWAIGTGKTPSVQEISNTICYIKEVIFRISSVYKNTKVLYGGSVDINNSKLFLNNDNINGLLVGGSSLKFNSFFSMLEY